MSAARVDDAELPELKRARGLWAANRFDDAAKLFAETAEKYPDNMAAVVDAARALGHRHEIKRAVEYLNRVRARHSDRPELPFILGQTFRMIHREDLARELLSAEAEAFRFDFQNETAFPAERKRIALSATTPGTSWGVIQAMTSFVKHGQLEMRVGVVSARLRDVILE